MASSAKSDRRVSVGLVIGAAVVLAGCSWLSERAAASSPVARAVNMTAPAAIQPQPARPTPTPGVPNLTLTGEQEIHADVATTSVAIQSLSSRLEVPGQVVYDQAKMAQVTAWVAGRLDGLYVLAVGDRVRRNQPVARIYSPELFADQQDYRSALATWHQVSHSPYLDVAAGARSLVEASRQRLLLLGVTPDQIAGFGAPRGPRADLTIRSAVQGVVIKKWVQLGQYVKTGDPLFDVVDLSRVWVEADVPEASSGQVHVGDRARIQLVAYPGKTFEGTVSLLYPTLDPSTRTVRVRIALANPDGRLRPQMYATVDLAGPARRQLVVPSSAVVDTGLHQWVWVEVANHTYSPRQVELGAQVGDRVAVVSGLSSGQAVVVSGGFLLDSSARLQGLLPRTPATLPSAGPQAHSR